MFSTRKALTSRSCGTQCDRLQPLRGCQTRPLVDALTRVITEEDGAIPFHDAVSLAMADAGTACDLLRSAAKFLERTSGLAVERLGHSGAGRR